MQTDAGRKKRLSRIKGIFYAILSSASFGFSPLFSVDLLRSGMGNCEILTYRWGIAAAGLCVVAKLQRKSLKIKSWDEFQKILLMSILRSITAITLLIGLANISSGVASTINFMYPVIVAAIMMLFFGEKKSFVTIGAIAVTILGVFLLASGKGLDIEGGNRQLGLTSSIISAFSFAAYYICLQKTKADKIESVRFTTWMSIMSAIYFFIGSFLVESQGIRLVTSGKEWMYIIGLGIWATMVSNYSGVKAVRRIGPTLTSVLGALQPLTAVILGIVFLDEHLGPKTIIGIILIMISVSVTIIHQQRQHKH